MRKLPSRLELNAIRFPSGEIDGECDLTAGSGPVTVVDDTGTFEATFPNITEPGEVTIESGTCDPAAPDGFYAIDVCYDVTSTVEFSGVVTICIEYDATGRAT